MTLHESAVITGSSSGIGKEITQRLLRRGYTVYGISRREARFEGDYYHVDLDLTDEKQISEVMSLMRPAPERVNLLVHCAGVGSFAPHEELPADEISKMVKVNLMAPLLLTRELLRLLKKSSGRIIAIDSFSALEASSFGAAYAATKAGLLHFMRSLQVEVRKAGVSLTTIIPDITSTPFYDDCWFGPGDDSNTYLTPECIGAAVESVLDQRPETVVSEIVLRPKQFGITKRKMR